MSDNRRNADWLLDTAVAKNSAVIELEMMVWYATDILLEADAIFRRYGPPPAPDDEIRGLLDAVRDYLLRVPPIDTDAHNHPLPERPGTPGEVGCGEAPASLGPHVDIHVDEEDAA